MNAGMPRIPLLPLDELDDDAREAWLAARERRGFAPNNTLLLARVPGLSRAMQQLSGAVLVPGRVGLELKYLAAHVSAMSAGSRFSAAHTANFAHTLAGTPVEKILALHEFETSDRFTDAERAALRLARAAGRAPTEVENSHVAELARHYDDDQIMEIVAAIALYAFFCRWNDMLATPLEHAPLRFAEEHLADAGWDAGPHGPAPHEPPPNTPGAA